VEACTDKLVMAMEAQSQMSDSGIQPRGEMTDVYESAANSGGYDHVNTAYWENAALSSLAIAGIPNISYGAAAKVARPWSR
jgi:hypothetical protein